MDAVHDRTKYWEFYEELGSKFPESEIVHADKSRFSSFYNAMSELKPFAANGSCSTLVATTESTQSHMC